MKVVPHIGKKAPLPQRGVSKALYETVESMAGPATFREVWDLLPAAIDSSSQIGTKKKILQSLQGMVYRGYFVHDENGGRWNIAPLSYYEARQQYIHDLGEAHDNKGDKPKKPLTPSIPEQQMHRMWLMIGLACGFLAGFIFGALSMVAMRTML
jgi:hypothetical protein